jgi:hypothetical protein
MSDTLHTTLPIEYQLQYGTACGNLNGLDAVSQAIGLLRVKDTGTNALIGGRGASGKTGRQGRTGDSSIGFSRRRANARTRPGGITIVAGLRPPPARWITPVTCQIPALHVFPSHLW